MSALEAAGWALSRSQSVSVVPMIQCRPQGMTNSTDFSVRRISPVVEWMRSLGTTRWMPLDARTWNCPRSPTIAWVSSVHTPVALTTCLARISYSPPALDVLHPGADHALALAQEAGHPRAVGDLRAVRRGRAHQGGHDSGRRPSGRRSTAARRPARPSSRRARRAGRDGGSGDGARAGPGRARGPSTWRRRARRPSPAYSRSQPLCCKRVQERHRLHQMRGEPLQQQSALLQRLAHEGEVEHLQIAQTAVDQLAGPAGGARRPVTRLDQPGGQAAGHGVERGARTDHAARPRPARPARARPLLRVTRRAAPAPVSLSSPLPPAVGRAGRTRRARPGSVPPAQILTGLPDFGHHAPPACGQLRQRLARKHDRSNPAYRSYLLLV